MRSPVYELNHREADGNRIFVRREDLLPKYLGGNKVRIADAFFRDMKKKGCDAMIAYGSAHSNLCRVIACRCHAEGIPCRVICSSTPGEAEDMVTSNSLLMAMLGAEIVPCAKDAIAPCVDECLAAFEKEGKKPYYIYGSRLGTGNEGVAASAYLEAYRDVTDLSELGIIPDYLFLASGTGATQSGLICGSLLAGDKLQIIGISVSRDKARGRAILEEGIIACLKDREIFVDEEMRQNIQNRICLEDAYRHGGYGLYDEEILSCMRQELLDNSLPMDPVYTGKAFLGMKDYLREHGIENKNILFLHTGGTPLFYDSLNRGDYQQDERKKESSC